MAIADGMRTHDEGSIKRYRMPDLLTLEEMKIYFAGTYGVGIEFVELSDEMRERATGVGTLPYSYEPSPRDVELATLRDKLGIDDDEKLKELHGRVMTRSEFEEKYGPQPDVAPPKEEPDHEAVGEGNSDEVDGPVPVVETEEERKKREEESPTPSQVPKQQGPGGELARLLKQQENK